MAPWKKRCASASLNLAPSIREKDLLITEVLGMLAALSGDSENWSGGDTKTGPPCGANY